MPLIAPFKGLRYNPKQVPSLSAVVTPPYDVISPKEQKAYYRRHRRNFIRVVYGRTYGSDTRGRNRYSRARRRLEQWVQEGVLRSDAEPAVYPYRQRYPLGGREHERWGLVALVHLDSRIFPHEETCLKPKKDRLRLLAALKASLSPIFGLIPDPTGDYRRRMVSACRRKGPVARAVLEGVEHTLWRISDPKWMDRIQSLLRTRELVIADGHHRWEAALVYREICRKKDKAYRASAPYNFALFYLASAGLEEPGLLATHRVIAGISKTQLRRLKDRLCGKHRVSTLRNPQAALDLLGRLRRADRIAVGLYAGNGSTWLLEPSKGSAYPLDVEWLHGELIPDGLRCPTEVTYTQDVLEGIRQVRQGRAQLLFLTQPPRLKEIFRRARAGQKMPGKTTYFHPKPLSGLVEYQYRPS